jgi:hypothetical protein
VRAESASPVLDADVGVVHETNVGLAQRDRDIKNDTALTTSVSGGVAMPLGEWSTASLTADVDGAAYERLGGLSHLSLGLGTALKGKLGLGAAAPWVRLWGSGARQEYEEDVRDGWRYALGLDVGTRLGERWDLRAGYAFDERIADHGRALSRRLPGDAFDTAGHTFTLRADFLYSEAVSLFAGYAVRDGEVVATTRRNEAIVAASTALTADPAFGRDFVAYKIEATVHSLSAGLSFALGAQTSLNVSYEHHIGLAGGGIDYHNHVVRAGFLYSY